MKCGKMILSVVVIVSVVCGLTFVAWGDTGGSGGDNLACVVKNPGAGAQAFRGVIAVEAMTNLGVPLLPNDVDFTLRLERSGTTGFFRSHSTLQDICSQVKESIVCNMLANDPQLVQGIITEFNLGAGTQLVITGSSITSLDTDPLTGGFCPSDAMIGLTGRASNLADIVLYATKP